MVRAIVSLYSWRYPKALLALMSGAKYRIGGYLFAFWTTQSFVKHTNYKPKNHKEVVLLEILYGGMLLQIALGLMYIWMWHKQDMAGGLAFGLALIVGYPVVWANLLALGVFVFKLVRYQPTKVKK